MTRRPSLAAILAAMTLAGCGPTDGPGLVVVTTWPDALRAEVEGAFGREGGSIAWTTIGPGDSPSILLEGRARPDLILGVPESNLVRMADAGLLANVDPRDPAPWRLVRRPGATPEPTRPAAGFYADPRDSAETLAQAKAVLATGGWPEGYRSLARRAALARPRPGPSSRTTSALSGADADRSVAPIEALGLIRGTRKAEEARRFLALLEARGLVHPPIAGALESARGDEFLADLLGAALVDAHGELRAAEVALRRSSRPEAADAAFGDRPPWPPASVAKLEAASPDRSLVEALAEQVAPDPEARAWLLESWGAPKRPIDGAILAELAGAAGGRLARDPRFRAWLRAEWAAWHRQLYRRVARVAGGYLPS